MREKQGQNSGQREKSSHANGTQKTVALTIYLNKNKTITKRQRNLTTNKDPLPENIQNN